MNLQESYPTPARNEIKSGILARAGQILFMFVFLGTVLFLSSGRINWTAAWVYLGISLLFVLINAFFMLRTNPETVAERGQAKGWHNWDKLISGLFALSLYLILPTIAGLDTRFRWTGEVGIVWHAIGAAIYTIGMALNSWAMITNAYFSTAARIQADRGQQVCCTGPYKYIRHPGYAGIMLQAVGIAILLGSWWAMIPALIAGGLILARTSMEDRMLQQELAGYLEYKQEVKYRILPGIW